MSIKELYYLYLEYPEIATDSRDITGNSLFFSLKGDKYNGNEFALQALKNGAKYAVVDEKEYAVDDRFILVDDSLFTLQELARLHRSNLSIPIIAITGTNGKTTTKELVNSVLSKKFITGSTRGNLNNHIGVPLTLLSFNKNTQIGIVELGANHQGEIKYLCEIAQPDYGIITNIGKAHLEGFGSFEGVKKAKAELYSYLSKNKKNVFVNIENAVLRELLSLFQLNAYTYGSLKEADCFVELLKYDPFIKIKFDYCEKDKISKEVLIASNIFGHYNFENIVAAICVGQYFNVNPYLIKEAVEEYVPDNNRSQVIKTNSNKLLLDAYNANPTSMVAAIENFYKMDAQKKVLILGDMLELGKDSSDEHKKILDFIMDKGFENVLLIGQNFSICGSKNNTFNSVDDFIVWLKLHPVKDSLVLIKGSRAIQLEKVVEYL